MAENMTSPQPPPAASPGAAAPTPVQPTVETRPLTWAEAVIGGLVMPYSSVAFYRHAARTPFIRALVCFLIIAVAISILSTAGFAIGLYPAGDDVGKVFANGQVPEITISNGVAKVDAPQPFTVKDAGGMTIILDTTGEVTRLDPQAGRQSLLLTRTEMHMIQADGRYQVTQLSQLNAVFGDPITLNEETVPRIWRDFSSIFSVVAFFSLLFWNTFVRLAYLALLALGMWGATRIFRKDARYVSVLVVGLYAIIPDMIIGYLLELTNITFVCLQTIILLPIWAAGLWLAYREKPLIESGSGLLFDAATLVGSVLAIGIAVNLVATLPNGALIMWLVAVVTAVGILAVYAIRLLRQPPAATLG